MSWVGWITPGHLSSALDRDLGGEVDGVAVAEGVGVITLSRAITATPRWVVPLISSELSWSSLRDCSLLSCPW